MGSNERFLAILGLMTLLAVSSLSFDSFHDLPGPHCATRSDPCCDQRQDDCSVPLHGKILFFSLTWISQHTNWYLFFEFCFQVPCATAMSSATDLWMAIVARITFPPVSEDHSLSRNASTRVDTSPNSSPQSRTTATNVVVLATESLRATWTCAWSMMRLSTTWNN